MTADGIEWCEALRFSDEEGRYVIKGPRSHPRKPDEEQVTMVPVDGFRFFKGTPVMCYGLKNAAHLNGKIGGVASRDKETGRCEVRFEDKSLKPVLVKQENLRIVFELPDE